MLIAGDVVIDNYKPDATEFWDRQAQAAWMRDEFATWLGYLDYDYIIGIAGNHDFVLQGKIALEMPWIYLNDTSIEIDGLKIHGSPMTPTFGGWAFMKPDSELPEHWDKIPEDVDVLVTHGPAYGYGDLTKAYTDSWGYTDPARHVGSSSLRWRLDNGFPNLKLHVFGHIHPANGVDEVDGRIYANVSHVNDQYKPANHAKVFDV